MSIQVRPIIPRTMVGVEEALSKAPPNYVDKNKVTWLIFDRWASGGSMLEAQYVAHSYGYAARSVADKDFFSSSWVALQEQIDKYASDVEAKLTPEVLGDLPGGITIPPITVPPTTVPPTTVPPTTVPPTTVPSSTTISDDPKVAIPAANDVVKSVFPGMNAAQRQVILAIGWLENHYGLSPAWQYKDATGKTVPTYNWGAIGVIPGAPYTEKPDKDKDGNPITRKVGVFPSMREGLIAFANKWAKGGVILSEAGNGSAFGVAKAMYENHYYTGSPDTDAEAIAICKDSGIVDCNRILHYARGIDNASAYVAGILGEPAMVSLQAPGKAGPPAPPTPVAASGSNTGTIAIAAAAGLGLFAFLRK